MKRSIALIVVCILVVTALLLVTVERFPNQGDSRQREVEKISELSTRLKDVQETATSKADTRVPVTTADSDTSIDGACTVDVVSGFRNYVLFLRSLGGEEEVAQQLSRPSSSLTRMSQEELQRIGVADATLIRTGPVVAESPNGAQIQIKTALPDCWVKCANARGESLRDAVLFFFDEEVRYLPNGEGNTALINFACWFFQFHYKSKEDVRLFAPRLIGTLNTLPGDISPDLVHPLMLVMCELARAHSDLRAVALEYLKAPWATDRAVMYWLVLTRGTSYSEWAAPISELLASDVTSSQWAAVEALRNFAANDTSGLTAEGVFLAIPDTLYRHPDATLRWAVYELVATYAGPSGEERLRLELNDSASPYRADALSFLASANKITGQECLGYAADPVLQEEAIAILGKLARAGGEELSLLRTLVADPDPSVRKRALSALGESGQLTVSEFEKLARDSDSDVQYESIRQIGMMKEPQLEALKRLANDSSLDPKARSKAYQEWLLDAPDEAVPEIFSNMYRDNDPEIREQGYLFTGALAIASGDEQAMDGWRALTPPSTLLAKAGVPQGVAEGVVGEAAVSLFDGNIREKVEEIVAGELDRLKDPAYQAEIRAHRTLVQMSDGLGFLDRRYVFQRRIIEYLGLEEEQ